MKTNVQTINSAASHSTIHAIAAWMEKSNSNLSFLSEHITNGVALFLVLFACSLTATILCATDQVAAYGWAAFFALLSVNFVIALSTFINKIVKE